MPTSHRQLTAKSAPWIAHIILVVTVLGFGYSAKNYHWLTHGELPTIEALAPFVANKTAEAISLQLPSTKAGDSASVLAHRQARNLQAQHDTWLDLTRSHAIYARNQTIFWGILWVLSLLLVVVLHISRQRARPNNSFKPKPLRGSA